MMKQIWTAVRVNFSIILITFEVFWIVVFLLDRVSQASGGGVPQFVYVNF
jgi:hypothetical protein